MKNSYRFLSNEEPTESDLKHVMHAFSEEVKARADIANLNFKNKRMQMGIVAREKHAGLLRKSKP